MSVVLQLFYFIYQYTPEMTYAALGLMAANVVGSGSTIIIRHMRGVHWATQVTHVSRVTRVTTVTCPRRWAPGC